MLTLLLAGGLSALGVGYAIAALRRYRALVTSELAESEADELERKLSSRRIKLEHGLARRNVLAIGRAALFAGTGCGVWELTGGSAHYLRAAVCFGMGLMGWMVTGEVYRRVGSLADAERALATARRKRQGVDQATGTG